MNEKEINISKFTASRLIKQYYEDYYNYMVTIKVKPRIIKNKLFIYVKKSTSLKGKNILETEKLNQRDISIIIHDYMKEKGTLIKSVSYESKFRNLRINYYGNDFELNENKKGYQKILEA